MSDKSLLSPVLPDDAHTVRGAPTKQKVTVAGSEIEVLIPSGFRLISIQEYAHIEQSLIRIQREYKSFLSSTDAKVNGLLTLNTSLVSERNDLHSTVLGLSSNISYLNGQLACARSTLQRYRMENRQLRAALSAPFRWLFNALLPRSISAERILRAEKAAEYMASAEGGKPLFPKDTSL